MRSVAIVLTGSWLVATFVVLGFSGRVAADEDATVDYERDIKPLLAKSCSACHGALKQESSLRLDTREFALKGGDSGVAIVPGKANESALIERIVAEGDERMPPHGEGEAVGEDKISLLRKWIDSGADGPANEQIPPDPRFHWSYQRPLKAAIPSNGRDDSVNPIDAFLESKRRDLQLAASSPANKRTWLRRVYLDLIGLPPTREQIADFLADDSPESKVRVVNVLLKSPRYGERWGRHWMDVWRYSDWSGYRNEIRNSQRHIWRWRDWIIQSLNEDMPYDQMVMLMLAGDELAPNDPQALAATGFLARNWYKFNRNVWLDSTVEHTSKAFLGATVNCARCHDHKYDPISQVSYYQMRAIFEPHQTRTDQVGNESDLTKDGLPRVYDADLSTPTYVFTRGNEKHPQKERTISPGLPDVLSGSLEVEPVELPVDAYYPFLDENRLQSSIRDAENTVANAEKKLQSSKDGLVAKSKALMEYQETPSVPQAKSENGGGVEEGGNAIDATGSTFLHDDFSKERNDLWRRSGGKWEYKNGRLIQSQVDRSRSTLISLKNHPKNFVARFKVKIIGGATYHSTGLSFDLHGNDQKSSQQTVYISAHAPEPKVQVSSTVNGVDAYPVAGRVKVGIERGAEYELEVAVRERLINVSVDGKLQLAYQTPHHRADGKFAVWAFDCAAEFVSVRVEELADSVKLAVAAKPTPMANKAAKPSRDTLEDAVAKAKHDVEVAELTLQRDKVAVESLLARIAADKAKYGVSESTDSESLSGVAGALGRKLALVNAKLVALQAKRALEVAQNAAKQGNQKKQQDALQKAEGEFKKKQAAVVKAEKESKEASNSYAPLGKEYPRVSSGRRLALARRIADSDNPLTARVAVNHIWLRHFGSGLVENPFDFGLRSPSPIHRDLLDWLAVELTEHNWSMKHIHRLIVTSESYGMSSTSGEFKQNSMVDPDNKYLWKMNARRLEAEVVRDAMLHVAGNLDLKMGGPEIDHKQGQATGRRSVYFRHAYEKKMKFLELFDAANETDCYRRSESVIPQQALAMSNSELSFSQSRLLARKLNSEAKDDSSFIEIAFEQILGRLPGDKERELSSEFLSSQTKLLKNPKQLSKFTGGSASRVKPSDDPAMRSRENLVHVIMNHNDFVTVR